MTDGILTDHYLPGFDATLRVGTTKGPAPLVVIVPGGGWIGSDPTDYVPLAQSLQTAGISTSLITYGGSETGSQFPEPLDDVACAARWSAFQLTALGYPPTQIFLAGHSAGGHLAVEVALTKDRFGGDCPMPPVTINGAIGMAGIYDLYDPTLPYPDLFAGGGTPEERSDVSPLAWVTDTNNPLPSIGVLLLVGGNDVVVPASQSENFAAALRSRGIEPVVDVLPAAEHNLGFPLALEIAPIIKFWVLGDAYEQAVPSDSAVPLPPESAAPADPASATPPSPVPAVG